MVDARIHRGGSRPDALIEVLHTVQELFGFLDRDALAYVSASLGVPPSRVFGVATFYSFFTLKPSGEHLCVVCTGTACYLDGASTIVSRIREVAGVEPGETTADGKLSVLTVRCLGVCSMAPVVVIDGVVSGAVTPASISDRLEAL
ncbi:MAG: NAD(P)H-dependent oxidoreductase subunit E [Acidimicrobiales bacterium]